MYDNLKKQLIRDEGLRLKPYRDSVNKLTVGCGRNLDDVGISQAEAMVLLDNDINRSAESLFKALPWAEHLDDARQGVLLALTFNMGINGLLQFHNTLDLIQGEKWDDAAIELLRSRWAEQVGQRAIRLANQLREGEYQ